VNGLAAQRACSARPLGHRRRTLHARGPMTAVQEDRPPRSLEADDAGFGRCDVVILSVVGRSGGEGGRAVREGICQQEVAASQILC
jgi:hypothetical protein